MVLSSAGWVVLAAATGFTAEMMLEEGHAICLDDLQMGQFLESLRLSVTGLSAAQLPPIPLFLSHCVLIQHGGRKKRKSRINGRLRDSNK